MTATQEGLVADWSIRDRHVGASDGAPSDFVEWEVADDGEIEIGEGIVAVESSLAAGSFSVAVADGPARLLITDVRGGPVTVRVADGILSIHHDRRRDDGGWSGWIGPVPLHRVFDAIEGLAGGRGGGRRHADVALVLPAPVPVSARAVSASVMFSSIDEARAQTVSGDVTASRVRGSLKATTVSGSVEAANADGRLSIKTISGDATVAGGRLEALHANTVSGDFVVDADLLPGSHRFKAVSGSLVVRIDPGAGLHLDARSTSGELFCGIGEPVADPRPGARTLSVTVGGGAASLSFQSVSGDLTVLGRPIGDGAV